MSDLIDRQKALDGLKYEMKYGAVIDQCGLDTAYDIIENIPSAEPERTAKVQKINGGVKTWEQCSRCYNEVYHRLPYCPGCGAKLDWSGDEDNK